MGLFVKDLRNYNLAYTLRMDSSIVGMWRGGATDEEISQALDIPLNYVSLCIKVKQKKCRKYKTMLPE